jgi:YVTN family beta-propeller protein
VKRINVALLFGLCAATFAGCGGGGADVGTSSVATLEHQALITQPAATQAMTMGSDVANPPPTKAVSIFDTAHGNTALPSIPIEVLAQGDVDVFDTAHGNAELPAITGGGLSEPDGVAVDPGGKLYIANLGTNSVSVFDTAHGNAVLPAITGGLNGPGGIAVT